ncbi:MAG: dihydrolipoamide acetyltransferase family protein [Acidimicrobiia bacterium]|nr:dihydrolipoamide acetyltransferase family protein [Acidimicrobiia bacterium]
MTEGAGPAVVEFDFDLPSLGADMESGRVTEWLVGVGDSVARGQVVARVETEKSDLDIEIWRDGVVEELLVPIGRELDVGTPVIRLRGRELEGAPPAASADDPVQTPDPTDAVDVPPTAPPISAPAETGNGRDRPRASPLARRLAAEGHIDLAAVRGSGPSGAIVAADIDPIAHRQLDDHPVPAGDATIDRVDRSTQMRRKIADRMSRANREIPHYFLQRDIDVTPLHEWLTERNARANVADRILPAAAYVSAVARAAARHPEMNGFWLDDHFEPSPSANVAMAISLRSGGLVTPQVAEADQRSIDDIMATIREMVAAARTGSLRASWMSGGSITVTSLGDTGADLVYGLISPPQVALVGFGRTSQRPWVVDDRIEPRPLVTATLSADHRATDGTTGSRFLAEIADTLSQPERLAT